jgi:membrane-associated phospholipid phosphatase/phosphoglycolate phosphatase-like HAD superfamily hydrolase
VPAADEGGRRGADLRAHRRVWLPAAALAASLLCFLVLAVLVHPNAPGSLDASINAFVDAHRSHGLTSFFTGYTGLGRWLVLAAATVAAIAALAWRARRREAVFLLIVMAVSPLLNQALKLLFERVRPPAESAVLSVNGYAFPSGHAMSSATFALALAVIAWPTRWRWPAAGLAATFALLMGASRVYLGVHWLTDVLAGWTLAVALVAATYLLMGSVAAPASRRSGQGRAAMPVEVVFLDWGGTLMVDDAGQSGPMATWPQVQEVEGAQETLRRLHPHYRVLVATNADDSGERDVLAALSRVGLDGLVDGVVSSRDVGARKPDAVFYRAALLRAGRAGLALAPARAVMVGDSWPNDVAGAQAAGLRAVWLNPSRARRPDGAAAPNAEIRELRDLPLALAELAGAAPVAPPRRAE